MGMKSPNPTDRRVQRTRRTLHEALLAMILERGWDQTSVLDVCARADVGRSTFYTHFADKEELLLSGFDELTRELRARRAGDGERLGFAQDLVEHVEGHLQLARALLGRLSGHAAHERLRQLVTDLVRDELSAVAPASPRLEPAVQYVSGGFFQLLSWWLEGRHRLTSTDVIALARDLTDRVVPVLADGSRRR